MNNRQEWIDAAQSCISGCKHGSSSPLIYRYDLEAKGFYFVDEGEGQYLIRRPDMPDKMSSLKIEVRASTSNMMGGYHFRVV